MRDEWQIDCSDHGPGVQWLQHGRNLREFTLLVPVVPVGVNSPGSMQTKPKHPPKKTTCNTSQLSKSIRSKESKGSNLRYLDSGRMSRHHGGHHNERLVRRTHSVCVALVPGWESLKIHWLNYHHCHCPHWSLIDAHFGRKSMQITTFKHTHVNLNLYRFLSNTSGGF
jgi:hypothetical protein